MQCLTYVLDAWVSKLTRQVLMILCLFAYRLKPEYNIRREVSTSGSSKGAENCEIRLGSQALAPMYYKETRPRIATLVAGTVTKQAKINNTQLQHQEPQGNQSPYSIT